ncbi:MAG TPA: NAD(P)-dependent oxidoreductase [Chthonomonas sp.]|uniref:NAD(P)-dependent oxidoreductase n=1 Tax=Chthonomonas sp. TaxID=2282153 RepID=UPI002B4ABA07|nr:NAD(P)-dependent oxidoreductase [Chthonomonas sp.]HLI48502.1 NAD(P)-dependent oxidoreductase [Chthonomonas sp.]
MIRIGSALFNADHSRLGEELLQTEAAGIDFFHFDVFDGYFTPDQAFAPKTIATLRPLSQKPFEVHLAVQEPLRFLQPLADAGVNLIFLPAESTPLLYETIYAVRERGLKVGLCLALGTSLSVLDATLPFLDAVLLLGRVTGEGQRGRSFQNLTLERIREVRKRIDALGLPIDLQAAGGLETPHCVEVCRAGASSLPIGAALHRESDKAAWLAHLRQLLEPSQPTTPSISTPSASGVARFEVLVASRSFGKNCPEVIEKLKAAGCILTGFELERAPTEEELLSRIGTADVLISGTEPVTSRVIEAAPKLKLIAKHGVGYENIALEAARARHIPVTLTGSAIAESVAELAFGFMLALARQLPQGDAAVKAGQWRRFVGVELKGKTLGIVGLGQIGKTLCRRAKAFEMNVVATEAQPDQNFVTSWGVELMPLETLLERADFVSLHVPVTPQTQRLIGRPQLQCMKPTAYLINTSRGELVDEEALYQALKEGRIAGAASDVFLKEPPGKHPLLSLPNFIAMPHCGGQTQEGLRRMGESVAENVLRVLHGQEPLYRIV